MNLNEELLLAIAKSDHLSTDIDWLHIDFGTWLMPKDECLNLLGSGQKGLDYTLNLTKGISYDNDYGTQHLTGSVVFTDGTWLSRGEYDGSEWWEFNKTPDKPQIKEVT